MLQEEEASEQEMDEAGRLISDPLIYKFSSSLPLLVLREAPYH